MKTLIKLTIVSVLILWSTKIKAQQAPMYTHYMYNTLVVNPGYAGSREAFTVTALHRSQWVGFKGAPTTQTLSMHTPLSNQNIGLGLSVINDKIGPSNNTSLIADFAYKVRLTAKSSLAFGLGGGVNILQSDLSSIELDPEGPDDPAFQENVTNHVTPHVGFGMYYSRERFYAGISTPNLLQNKNSEVNNILIRKDQIHCFLIAGTMISITDGLAFKPTTLIKLTPAAPAQMDLTASFILFDKLLLGAMFRTGDAFGALIGFDFTPQLHLGYSYDWSYGLETARYNQGSHEIVLRYDFLFFGKKQIHSPRYF
jgi:type IX secretion system PorP/SprF family membrane protein